MRILSRARLGWTGRATVPSPLGSIALALMAMALLACGADTKHDILTKAETVETKHELEQTLGAPDDRSKLGPVETWTYEASDGKVTFLVMGDKVSLRSTSASKSEE